MPSYDFEVDIKSLILAAQTAAKLVKLAEDKDVDDYLPGKEDLANPIVWDAVDEFQERWERGINDMTDDIESVAGALGEVAMSYMEYDEESDGEG